MTDYELRSKILKELKFSSYEEYEESNLYQEIIKKFPNRVCCLCKARKPNKLFFTRHLKCDYRGKKIQFTRLLCQNCYESFYSESFPLESLTTQFNILLEDSKMNKRQAGAIRSRVTLRQSYYNPKPQERLKFDDTKDPMPTIVQPLYNVRDEPIDPLKLEAFLIHLEEKLTDYKDKNLDSFPISKDKFPELCNRTCLREIEKLFNVKVKFFGKSEYSEIQILKTKELRKLKY